MVNRLQKKLALILIIAVVLSLNTSVFAAERKAVDSPPSEEFLDLEGSYASVEIKALAEKGIISGFEDNTFRPTGAMTRAQLAKVLVMAIGLPEDAASTARFTDVPADAWYKGSVGALVKSGITDGTSETTFSPDSEVSREQLAVFYIRAFGLEQQAKRLNAAVSFSDQGQIAGWATSCVALAFKMGFIQGIDNGDGSVRFAPGVKADRQALARLTYEYVFNKEAHLEAAAKVAAMSQPDVEPPTPTPTATPAPMATPAATPAPSPSPAPESSSGGGSDEEENNVKKNVTSIVVSGAEGAVEISVIRGTLQMYANVLPSEATNKNVIWSVSNEDLATITATGLLTAVKDGTVTIIASAQDGSGTVGSLDVVISNQTAPLPPDTYAITNIHQFREDIGIQVYRADAKYFNVFKKSIGMVSPKPVAVTSSLATFPVALADINDLEVLVYSDAAGLQQLARYSLEGTIQSGRLVPIAVVPVSSISVNGASGTNTVSVHRGTLQMQARIAPTNAYDKRVSWVVSDPTIAMIDNDGLLTALDNGTVRVTATAQDGSNVSGFAEITISNQLHGNTYSIIQINRDTAGISVSGPGLPDNLYFNVYNKAVGETVETYPVAVGSSINSWPPVYEDIGDLEVWIYSDFQGRSLIAKYSLSGNQQVGILQLIWNS